MEELFVKTINKIYKSNKVEILRKRRENYVEFKSWTI